MGNKATLSKKQRARLIAARDEKDEFRNAIESPEEWERLSVKPKEGVFARVQVCKTVIDLSDLAGLDDGQEPAGDGGDAADGDPPFRPTVYFLNSNKWWFHVDFAVKYLMKKTNVVGITNFLDDQYYKASRRFVLMSITYYMDQDLWTFELWPGDNLSGDRVAAVYARLQELTYFGSDLKYRPASSLHEELLAGSAAAAEVPTISSDELFAGVQYQPLTTGTAMGRLRVMTDNATLMEEVEPGDILVVVDLPLELPLCAGLVTACVQTPLCHVAILSASRGTPNCCIVGAATDADILALDGQPVELTVTLQDYTIRGVSRDQVAAWALERAAARQAELAHVAGSLRLNTEVTALVHMPDYREKDMRDAVGSKAAQLCLARQVILRKRRTATCSVVADGYVIPVSHYIAFRDTHASAEVAAVMEAAANDAPADQLRDLLDQVRDAFAAAPLPDELSSWIWSVVDHWREEGVATDGVILRSSTNAEDLPGFSGAGQYESVVVAGDACESHEALGAAIVEVWTSLWNLKGFTERRFVGFDESRVAMAVLVQPLYATGVVANGVAISGNPFRSDFGGIFLNSQVPGVAVTDGAQGKTSEQILLYDEGDAIPEVLSRSSENQGRPLLTDADCQHLFTVVTMLHKVWLRRRVVEDTFNAVDVEYMILDDQARHVAILQCRPYTLVHHTDGAVDVPLMTP